MIPAPYLDDKLFLGSVKLDRLHDINVETRFSVRLNLREAPKQVSHATRNKASSGMRRVSHRMLFTFASQTAAIVMTLPGFQSETSR
jgi:hypothetical protein